MNGTRLLEDDSGNLKVEMNSSTAVFGGSDQPRDIETYLIPSLMSCPLFVCLYIIYKLYKKLKLLNEANALNTPMLMFSSPFETDL